MTDIFDYPVLPEMPFLESLVEELEGTFDVIAYSGHSADINFIKSRQEYFRKKYGPYLDHVESDVGVLRVFPAYQTLQDLLVGNPAPEDIRRACEDCLAEHLTGYVDEVYANIFERFYPDNP